MQIFVVTDRGTNKFGKKTCLRYNPTTPRAAVNTEPLTFEQYLEFEAVATTRHEFVDGFMFAMAGASDSHNLVSLNIATAARAATRGSSCRVQEASNFLAPILP
ncbi:MAG: hypothetical protein ACK41E_09110 [Deinococcales bacterium]